MVEIIIGAAATILVGGIAAICKHLTARRLIDKADPKDLPDIARSIYGRVDSTLQQETDPQHPQDEPRKLDASAVEPDGGT